jgi:hypothetical protein
MVTILRGTPKNLPGAFAIPPVQQRSIALSDRVMISSNSLDMAVGDGTVTKTHCTVLAGILRLELFVPDCQTDESVERWIEGGELVCRLNLWRKGSLYKGVRGALAGMPAKHESPP